MRIDQIDLSKELHFEFTLSSLAALAMAEKEKVARKSHTLDHRGDRSSEGADAHGRSPIKKDKKEKVNIDTIARDAAKSAG